MHVLQNDQRKRGAQQLSFYETGGTKSRGVRSLSLVNVFVVVPGKDTSHLGYRASNLCGRSFHSPESSAVVRSPGTVREHG